jgi:hypothetical protein
MHAASRQGNSLHTLLAVPPTSMQADMLQHSQGNARAQLAVLSELLQRASQGYCGDARCGTP